ncbi:polysaccharide deacetylase family protein [Phytoactinopolyspora mesophila]|uniref:Polysaccharide deacetylase family protein n=1 Tax=Phytoactinopolyspora mesophila TaxID=2650750 RepID=A0A7K3LYE2_9ACTN|nr:polysaccharide deacetylase family protein [Phytoactinopolyspora mesophila]NDL56034.1 polysaccharide deacetylase family protein [Phytoactinopolyspora mesophila]
MKVSAPVVVGLVVGLFAYGMANNGSGDETISTSGNPASSPSPDGDGSADTGTGRSGDDDAGSSDSGSSGSGGGTAGDYFPDTGGIAIPDLPPISVDAAVTLTFDDGPHATYTPQILDMLAAHDAHAVFCVVGEKVRERPDLVRRIVDEGHALCNHTYSHDHELSTRSATRISEEISDTAEAIDDAVPGAGARFFRQPGTHVSPEVAPIVEEHGLTALDWTVDPKDWDRPGAAGIAKRVIEGVEPGAVVLLHDGGGDRSETVRALAYILAILDAVGYDTVVPPTS